LCPIGFTTFEFEGRKINGLEVAFCGGGGCVEWNVEYCRVYCKKNFTYGMDA
jgi:hypothetical protein